MGVRKLGMFCYRTVDSRGNIVAEGSFPMKRKPVDSFFECLHMFGSCIGAVNPQEMGKTWFFSKCKKNVEIGTCWVETTTVWPEEK